MTSAPESSYDLMWNISTRFLQECRQELEETIRRNMEAFATDHIAYNGDLPKILMAPAMPEGEIMLVSGNQLGKSSVKMLWLDEAADLQKKLNEQDSHLLDALKYMGESRIVPIIQPEKKKVSDEKLRERTALEKSEHLAMRAKQLYDESARAKSYETCKSYQKEAERLWQQAAELKRTLDPDCLSAMPKPLKTQHQEEIARLERSVQTYRLDAESQRAQVKSLKEEIVKIQHQHERMRGSLSVKEVDQPGTLSAMHRMETDLGKLRAFLGTEKFDAITTGKVVAKEPPEPRGKWSWEDFRKVR